MSQAVANPNTPPRTPLDVKLFYGFITVLVVAAVGLLLVWRPAPAKSPGYAPAQPRSLGAFVLTNQTGRTITNTEMAGKLLVVNFVHTSCSVSCLQVNQRMAEIQKLTVGQSDVQLLSLTVDPRTDTPPVLAEFGQKFGADVARWHLLTGDKGQLYSLIETSFLTRDPKLSASTMPGGFLDVDRIAVVDQRGQVRRYFDGMSPTTPPVIVAFLSDLRKETQAQ